MLKLTPEVATVYKVGARRYLTAKAAYRAHARHLVKKAHKTINGHLPDPGDPSYLNLVTRIAKRLEAGAKEVRP